MAKKSAEAKKQDNILPQIFIRGSLIPKLSRLDNKHTLGDEAKFEKIQAAIQFPHVIKKAEAVLSERNGCLLLDAEDAENAGVADEDLEFFKGNILVFNQLVSSGHLKLSHGIEIQSVSSLFAKATIIDATVNGTRYLMEVETTWLGTRFYINKALLNKIAELVEVGGSIVGVVAGLQAAGIITAGTAVVTAAVATIIILGAKALKALDFCNGIYVLIPFVPGPPVPYPAF